ncbi:MAG TPA: Rha family transcriptional regulator [Cyanophyceae cyanobacterium]
MSQIEAFSEEGVLVVDSRLICVRLDIEHITLMETIDKYQTQIEQAFGIIRFKTEKKKGRGRPQRYALLNEEQATFVMTLSRNTETVIQCKIELVQAFSIAKQLLLQSWQQRRLESKTTRHSFTDTIEDYISRHPELSDNDKRWMFTNVSQQVDLAVFGRVAKKLAADLDVPRENLRDSFTSEELQLVREVENTAMRLIDIQDTHPIEAVKQAKERLLVPTQTRKLKAG